MQAKLFVCSRCFSNDCIYFAVITVIRIQINNSPVSRAGKSAVFCIRATCPTLSSPSASLASDSFFIFNYATQMEYSFKLSRFCKLSNKSKHFREHSRTLIFQMDLSGKMMSAAKQESLYCKLLLRFVIEQIKVGPITCLRM